MLILAAAALLVVDVSSGRVLESQQVPQIRLSPGSTLKPFTALALLGTTGFRPDRTVACRREVRLAGRSLDCSHPELASPLDLATALAFSCNSYFTTVSRQLDPSIMAATLRRFGFDAPASATPEQLLLEGVGEWGVSTTPLELAQAYRKLAQLRIHGDRQNEAIWAGMTGAVEAGTAQRAKPTGSTAAGKTGTSGGHAWFAGWAPAGRPQVVVVVLTAGGHGGTDAAPVARAAFERHLKRTAFLRVRVRDRGVIPIDLEEYVAGVVQAESSVFTQAESLKAMAVAARTYAVHHRGRHGEFDLCDTTHCQAFRATPEPAPRLRAAVEDTEGELLWFDGGTAATFYHRHCGGTTAGAREVWPELRAPYLRQQSDTYCLRERSKWQAELPHAPGDTIEIASRTASGRVAALRVNGRLVTAGQLHKRVGDQLGWAILRSNDYHLFERGGQFVFQGYGFGHGVGMCQAGADERARAGIDYRGILVFYYPGTTLGINAQGFHWTRGSGERVDVFASSDAETRDLVHLADLALRDAERRSGLALRDRARLRAYPTTSAFRDATGQPGWLAASTLGRTIRLQPVGVLRSRGALDAAIAHEMLHLVIESNAVPSLPPWFREGLVLSLGPTAKAGQDVPPAVAQQYAHDRVRVSALLDRYGRGQVLGWVRSGLPREASDSGGKQE